jgi:hypothetical protein
MHVGVSQGRRGRALSVRMEVAASADGFLVEGALPEWQRSLSRGDLEQLLATIRGGRDRPES